MNLNATIFGQVISFCLFVWFCMKYIWPSIMMAIETRQKEIEDTLKTSRQIKEEYCMIQKQMNQIIQDTKEKSAIILNKANEQKLLILEEAKNKAIQETKKILSHSQLEIDMQVKKAHESLQKEIINLSLLMTEKIIKKDIQKDENKCVVNNVITLLSEIKKSL